MKQNKLIIKLLIITIILLAGIGLCSTQDIASQERLTICKNELFLEKYDLEWCGGKTCILE